MLLVHDEEARVADGGEDGRARPDHGPGLSRAHAVPRLARARAPRAPSAGPPRLAETGARARRANTGVSAISGTSQMAPRPASRAARIACR